MSLKPSKTASKGPLLGIFIAFILGQGILFYPSRLLAEEMPLTNENEIPNINAEEFGFSGEANSLLDKVEGPLEPTEAPPKAEADSVPKAIESTESLFPEIPASSSDIPQVAPKNTLEQEKTADEEAVSTIDLGPKPKPIEGLSDFAGAPPVPDTLRQMAEGEAPEVYTVQGGDTLYDICDQLLDEPGYWPKLWALNPDINNPHFIYPGMQLRFYEGSVDSPPFLQVIAEDALNPVDNDSQLSAEQLALDPKDVSHLLLNETLPQASDIISAKDLPGLSIDQEFEFAGFQNPSELRVLEIPAFILEEEPEILGRIVIGSQGHTKISLKEGVVIQADNTLNSGTSYTVVEKMEGIEDEFRGENLGYRYEFKGHLKVLKSFGEGYFLAAPSRLRLGFDEGDYVIAYRSTRRSFDPRSLAADAQADGQTVVGFDKPDGLIGGKGSMIFLNNLKKSLREGQLIYLSQSLGINAMSQLSSHLEERRSTIAAARIIDDKGSGACAYVVTGNREIRLGDMAGPKPSR